MASWDVGLIWPGGMEVLCGRLVFGDGGGVRGESGEGLRDVSYKKLSWAFHLSPVSFCNVGGWERILVHTLSVVYFSP